MVLWIVRYGSWQLELRRMMVRETRTMATDHGNRNCVGCWYLRTRTMAMVITERRLKKIDSSDR